jgi:7-cyano-7-deazaguanine synthase in queuosine biosynthesis
MSTILILSGGGIKGAVAAARYVRDHEIILLHVDHGQAASAAESRALAMLAAHWPKSRLCSATLPALKHMPSAVRAGGGGVISSDPGRKQSEEAARLLALPGLMPAMLSVAAQAAMRFGASSIVVGVSAHVNGEHIGLPGAAAGPEAMREALHAFDIMLEAMLRPKARIRVDAPLVDLTYAQIIKLGDRFKIPFERTHTCEAPAPTACGQCPSCSTRSRAFLDAAIPDPTTQPKAATLRPLPVA